MAQNLPYGLSQTLTCGAVTVTFDECDFNTTDELPAGYDRRYNPEQLMTLEYSVTGEPIIRSSCFTPKYSFRWSLFLSAEKVIELYALLAQQRQFVIARDSQYAITLDDNRLIEVETFPITRSQTGTPVDVSGITVPPDTSLYFPVFKIKIDEPVGWTNWLFELNSQMYYIVELTGQELDLV